MVYGTLGYGSQAYGAWEYGTRRPVLLSSGPTSITLTASAGINRLLALSSNQTKIEAETQPVTLVLVRKLDGAVGINVSSNVDLDVLMRLGGVSSIVVATTGAIHRVIDVASVVATVQVHLYGALRKEWEAYEYPQSEWSVVLEAIPDWASVEYGHSEWVPLDHFS